MHEGLPGCFFFHLDFCRCFHFTWILFNSLITKVQMRQGETNLLNNQTIVCACAAAPWPMHMHSINALKTCFTRVLLSNRMAPKQIKIHCVFYFFLIWSEFIVYFSVMTRWFWVQWTLFVRKIKLLETKIRLDRFFMEYCPFFSGIVLYGW